MKKKKKKKKKVMKKMKKKKMMKMTGINILIKKRKNLSGKNSN